jgi:hypothetical protein
MRSDSTGDKEQAAMDRMKALEVRKRIAKDLARLTEKPATKKQGDCKWMVATLSNTQLALGDKADAANNEAAFRAAKPADWEVETFEATKKEMAAQATKYRALRKKMGL